MTTVCIYQAGCPHPSSCTVRCTAGERVSGLETKLRLVVETSERLLTQLLAAGRSPSTSQHIEITLSAASLRTVIQEIKNDQ